MKIDEFTSTRREVRHNGGASTIFYLNSHLIQNADEHVKIERLNGGLCVLEIENHCYSGSLDELEEILWKWYSEDWQ